MTQGLTYDAYDIERESRAAFERECNELLKTQFKSKYKIRLERRTFTGYSKWRVYIQRLSDDGKWLGDVYLFDADKTTSPKSFVPNIVEAMRLFTAGIHQGYKDMCGCSRGPDCERENDKDDWCEACDDE